MDNSFLWYWIQGS